MKTIGQALADMLPAFRPLGAERAALGDALGRVLAQDVVAGSDLPPFANSAMDGWAVRAEDLAAAREGTPVSLPVAGESRAGGPLPDPLVPGTCVRIFTGAPLPDGADAVVMQEDVTRAGARATFRSAPARGAHVRGRGEDLRAGTRMLTAGTQLGPGELGLLASQGHAAATVWRAPRVAILSTGDELRDVSEPARPGSIVNSNAYALAAQVREAGAEPWVLPNVADVKDEVVRRVREGLAADVLLTIGGVSVGDYDVVKDALAEAGVAQAFWKVAMKPGKPLAFGTCGGRPVVGLPGNPVSAMVTFEVFVRPGLRRMLGDPRPFRRTAAVALAAPYARAPGRVELARASLARDGARLVAKLQSRQGSGALTSMVGVDAFVVLPADRERFEAGDLLEALLLDARLGAAEPPFA